MWKLGLMPSASRPSDSLPPVPSRSVPAFAAVLLALSWLQLAFVAAEAGGWELPAGAESAILLLGGFLSPLWAMLVVGGMVLGWRGLGRLLRGSVRLGPGYWPYAGAAGGIVGAVALAALLTSGPGWPDAEDDVTVGLLALVLLGGLVANLIEQLAWRAWLQRGLQRKLTPVAANAVVGVVWALWHLPLFFIDGTAQHDAGLSFLTYLPLLLVLSIFLGEIYNASDGSVLPVVVGHTAFNASISVVLLPASGAQANTLLLVLTGLFAVTAAVAVARRRRLGTQEPG